MKITLAQVGASRKEKDIERFYSILKRLEKVETDIIIFPEYFPIWPTLSEYEEEVRERAKQFAKENDEMVVYGCSRNKEYNSLIVAMPSGEEKVYDKRLLFAYEKNFKKGEGDLITNYKGLKIGFFICYEVFFPELIRDLAFQDLDLLLGISKIPKSIIEAWESMIKTRVFENMIPIVIASNYFSKYSKRGGGSLAIKPPLKVIANPSDNQKLTTFDLKIKERWRCFREKKSPKKPIGEMFKQEKFFFPGDRYQFLDRNP